MAGKKGMRCLQRICGQSCGFSERGQFGQRKKKGSSRRDSQDAERNTPSECVSLNKRRRKEMQTYDTATQGVCMGGGAEGQDRDVGGDRNVYRQ